MNEVATRSVEIIINAKAGRSDKTAMRALLVDLFSANGIDARIFLAKRGAQVVELARRATQSDAQTIVVGGGDGTISTVASMLVGTDKMLGVLPIGTLNHFAKDLRIPLDLEGAARTVIAGHSIRIDVGEVNERIFVNNSSLGLYPRIVHERKQNQKLGHGKWPAFIWAVFSVLRRYPFLDVRLGVDGKTFRTRTPIVFIGNNEYEVEGLSIGTRARLDAGQLSLYVSPRTGRLGLLKLALNAILRRLNKAEELTAMRTTEVWIETRRRRLHVSTDGEVVMMRPPLHYQVRPRALQVIVPLPESVET
jgi:YegS/Rv2252/BmrU family lipid kinase